MQRGRKSTVWLLPESLEPDPFIADICRAFSVVEEPASSVERTWFDTFDWRLFRRGLLLYNDARGWSLRRKDSNEAVAGLRAERCGAPIYAWDLPACRIRSLLEPVLAMRRLLPLVTLSSRTRTLRILNSDGKTVVRGAVEEHVLPGNEPPVRTARLQEIRGYAGDYGRLVDFLGSCGVKDVVDLFHPVARSLAQQGRRPLDYTSKFAVALAPQEPAQTAMITIYRHLLETMQRNEAGIIADLDSEFLHDFRVAVRRTRSGLGLVKKVLPGRFAGKAKKDFSWLGGITGPTRDLDVYLLYESKYRAGLPAALQEGLDSYFAGIRTRREKAYRELVRHLRSRKYGRILAGWEEFLLSGERLEAAENGGRPVIELAGEIIVRKYRKVIGKGAAITSSSPDEALHRLRIECKKLRYVLEFFSSLFPPQDMKIVIKPLKGLQNNLGDFNDLSVQQGVLRDYLAGLAPGSPGNRQVAASLGGLLANLHHEQQQVRGEFSARFDRFAADSSARLAAGLFRPRTVPGNRRRER